MRELRLKSGGNGESRSARRRTGDQEWHLRSVGPPLKQLPWLTLEHPAEPVQSVVVKTAKPPLGRVHPVLVWHRTLPGLEGCGGHIRVRRRDESTPMAGVRSCARRTSGDRTPSIRDLKKRKKPVVGWGAGGWPLARRRALVRLAVRPCLAPPERSATLCRRNAVPRGGRRHVRSSFSGRRWTAGRPGDVERAAQRLRASPGPCRLVGDRRPRGGVFSFFSKGHHGQGCVLVGSANQPPRLWGLPLSRVQTTSGSPYRGGPGTGQSAAR
jgi:hypothetical protein